jgi:hypothetical protein
MFRFKWDEWGIETPEMAVPAEERTPSRRHSAAASSTSEGVVWM